MADIQGGTTSEGIHLGAMAGTVDLIQRCYTGIEIRDQHLWLNPALPEELTHLCLRLRFRDQTVEVHISHDLLRVRAVSPETEAIRPAAIHPFFVKGCTQVVGSVNVVLTSPEAQGPEEAA